MAVFWEIPKDTDLLYMYTEIMTVEYSASPFNLYTAVKTVNFRCQCLMVNSNVSSKYFIFKALKSMNIHICTFLSLCENLQRK
jgi:hypothetical protein